MSLESSLFTFITGDAVIGPLIGTRMYPMKLPQSPTLPAMSYFRVTSGQEYELEGQEVGVRPARFQFDCWDKEPNGYEGILALGAAVRARLSGYMGAMGADTVQGIMIEDEMDLYEAETQIWHRVIEAVIWYE